MRYLDEIDTIASTEPDNPLIVGTALHTGIEKGVDAAIEEYFMSFPIIDEGHINEAIKLEYLIPKAKKLLPPGEYEVEIQDDDFIGFIDLLAPATVLKEICAILDVDFEEIKDKVPKQPATDLNDASEKLASVVPQEGGDGGTGGEGV